MSSALAPTHEAATLCETAGCITRLNSRATSEGRTRCYTHQAEEDARLVAAERIDAAAALAAAEASTPSPRWDREKCLIALRRFRHGYGRVPLLSEHGKVRNSAAGYQRVDWLPSDKTLVTLFGTRAAAYAAAGFPQWELAARRNGRPANKGRAPWPTWRAKPIDEPLTPVMESVLVDIHETGLVSAVAPSGAWRHETGSGRTVQSGTARALVERGLIESDQLRAGEPLIHCVTELGAERAGEIIREADRG